MCNFLRVAERVFYSALRFYQCSNCSNLLHGASWNKMQKSVKNVPTVPRPIGVEHGTYRLSQDWRGVQLEQLRGTRGANLRGAPNFYPGRKSLKFPTRIF